MLGQTTQFDDLGSPAFAAWANQFRTGSPTSPLLGQPQQLPAQSPPTSQSPQLQAIQNFQQMLQQQADNYNQQFGQQAGTLNDQQNQQQAPPQDQQAGQLPAQAPMQQPYGQPFAGGKPFGGTGGGYANRPFNSQRGFHSQQPIPFGQRRPSPLGDALGGGFQRRFG